MAGMIGLSQGDGVKRYVVPHCVRELWAVAESPHTDARCVMATGEPEEQWVFVKEDLDEAAAAVSRALDGEWVHLNEAQATPFIMDSSAE